MPLQWTNTGSTPVTMFGIEVAPGQTLWIANNDPQTSEITAGLLDDRGNYDASGNEWPSEGGSGTNGEIFKGDLWIVSVTGTLGAKTVEVGDNIRALTDNPGQTASNWSILSTGLGFVPAAVTDSRFPSADQKASFDAATTLGPDNPPIVKGTDTAADVSSTNKLQSTTELNATYLRHLPAEYAASDIIKNKTVSVAADRQAIVLPQMRLDINGTLYYTESTTELSVATGANWDSSTPTDYTVAVNRRAIPIYVYACVPESGQTPDFILSANASYPSGYTADNSRKIGAFRTLAIDIGTIAGHPFTGYLCGDVHKTSVKCLKNRPADKAFGEGMVWLGHPDLTYQLPDLWVDMYLLSGTGANAVSTFGATISDSRTWLDFVDDLAAVGKRLLYDYEFQVAAYGSPEQVNIYGSKDPDKTGLIGTYGQTTGTGLNDFSIDRSAFSRSDFAQHYEITIDATGTPDSFKWRQRYPNGTWGSYTTGVAITGGWQTLADDFKIKFTATTGHTLNDVFSAYIMDAPLSTAAVPIISHAGCWGMVGNLWQWLLDQSYRFDGAANHTHSVTVSGDPQTVTSGNQSGDVAPAWGWYGLPGSRGQLYRQGSYGDVKLLAGGAWGYGSRCGSRSRDAAGCRWYTSSDVGARGCARSRRL